MVKSAAERQAEFREKSKNKFKRLDTLLPVEVFNLLHDNAKEHKLTKAAYIAELLHGNNTTVKGIDALLSDNEKSQSKESSKLQNDNDYLKLELKLIKEQVKAASGDREAKQALKKERDELLAQVKELERVAALDEATLDDIRIERDKLLHANTI